MRRTIVLLVLSVLAPTLLALGVSAQEDGHFALDELYLLGWEDIPGGQPTYDAPLCAAIVMGWHASHGYPQLLPDQNDDGRIDEEDAVILATAFAGPMGANGTRRVSDPWLVDAVASYVGERYPDQMVLLVFDESFPEEYSRDIGPEFDPWRYTGIEIIALEDPTHEAFTTLLEEQRPGIVGFGLEPNLNRFSVSRSFSYYEDSQGWPVDLVNLDRGSFGTAPVWETHLQWQPHHWGLLTPEWIPFESFIVLVEKDLYWQDSDDAPGQPQQPPSGQNDGSGESPGVPILPPGGTDGGSGDNPSDSVLPPGSSGDGSGNDPSEEVPPPGGSDWSGGESSDVHIEMIRVGMGDNPRVDAAPGDQVQYNLYVMQWGPDIPRNVVAELRLPAGVSLDWIEGNPTYDWREGNPLPGETSPEDGLVRWEIDEMTLQQATPGVPGTRGVDMWLQWLQVTIDETTCGPIHFNYSVTSTTPDPDLTYNTGTLTAQIGPCDESSAPGEDPAPTTLPNLWVTSINGCWSWSSDDQEHVIATVTGVIHNGGQASASGVRARITAGSASRTVYVGTVAAGRQKTVSATIDVGAYDSVNWPIPTRITADPSHAIQEADELNNTTDSSLPESNGCD